MDLTNFKSLNTRQQMAVICYYATKYARINQKNKLIPPTEFGDSFRDFDVMVGAHYGRASSTVRRLRDLFIARFPAIPQNGWRTGTDDKARLPHPMEGPVASVYRAAKRMGRVNLFEKVVRNLLPTQFRKRSAETAPGFGADDNNTKPRVAPNNVKGKKTPKVTVGFPPTPSSQPIPTLQLTPQFFARGDVYLEVNGTRIQVQPNTRIDVGNPNPKGLFLVDFKRP